MAGQALVRVRSNDRGHPHLFRRQYCLYPRRRRTAAPRTAFRRAPLRHCKTGNGPATFENTENFIERSVILKNGSVLSAPLAMLDIHEALAGLNCGGNTSTGPSQKNKVLRYIGVILRLCRDPNSLQKRGLIEMTYLDVVFSYDSPPGENELRAIDSMRDVYGIRSIRFNEKERTVRVEFDASRMKQDAVAKLLRTAGIDIRENVALA